KNQLGLVRAFRNLPQERLIVLGNTAPNCMKYRAAVEAAASSNVEFHESVPHSQMVHYWTRTKVLVQPSYIETPGLAALEAAGAGIPVVVSDVPPVREYFGETADYCRPHSVRSIAQACRAAAGRPGRDASALAQRFRWQNVLAPLAAAY